MSKRPKRDFKEYLQNPDLFREEAREIDSAAAAKPAKEAKEAKLAELVAAMYSRPLENDELWKLRKGGQKVVPLLLEALGDKKFLLHRYGPGVLDGSAMETALEFLESYALPPANILRPALRHEDEYLRYNALYYLARCGNDDAIAVLKSGLASESERCRTYTLMGLEFLKHTSRGSARFRRALFKAALPLLKDEEHGPAEHAPRALLVLDNGQAVTVLLGEDVFRADNGHVNEVLRALKDANVPVPGSRLRALLGEIKDRATSYPFDYAYADGLILLVRAEGKGAKDLIADARKWGNERVKTGAAEAAELAAGVKDAYGFVVELYEQEGAEGLSEPQVYYLTLSWLDAEVRNGGFSQYFFNSSSDLACYAVDAAKAVGARQAARIIRKAIALFGKDGPDSDREERMDQLSGIDLVALEKLDDEYYRCPDQLGELLPMFVARHPEAFQPTQ